MFENGRLFEAGIMLFRRKGGGRVSKMIVASCVLIKIMNRNIVHRIVQDHRKSTYEE